MSGRRPAQVQEAGWYKHGNQSRVLHNEGKLLPILKPIRLKKNFYVTFVR